jgi:hypothetical protein
MPIRFQHLDANVPFIALDGRTQPYSACSDKTPSAAPDELDELSAHVVVLDLDGRRMRR